MRRSWIEAGWSTGLIAAAATSGALVGFGLRFGTPWRAFNTIAAATLARGSGSLGAPVAFTVVGVALHVLASIVWGLLYAFAVERSGGHRWLWGVVVAFGMFWATWAIAALSGAGLGSLLPLFDRIAIALVLALALPLGMRLALPAIRRG